MSCERARNCLDERRDPPAVPEPLTSAASVEAFASRFKAGGDEPVYVLLGVQGSGTNLLSKLLTRAFTPSVLHDQSLVVRTAGRLGASPSSADVEHAFRRIHAATFPGPVRRRLIKPSIHPDSRLEGIEPYFRAASILPVVVHEP